MSDTVKPMALSQVVRLGSMAVEEARGPVIQWSEPLGPESRPCGACFLGTVLVATEADLTAAGYSASGNVINWVDGMYRRIHDRWPWTLNEVQWLGWSGSVPVVSMLAFEYSRKSRTEIADWIESIEQQQHGSSVPILDTAMSEVRA